MIKFEFNGKPFNPKTFEEQIFRAAMEQVANEMHERVSSIRHPGTGEFPTVIVSGTSVEDMSMRIDGSPELLQIVNERLGVAVVGASGDAAPSLEPQPKVFLSWGWEDRALAEPIANALMAKGIDTWWSEWCINAGDSLRQKIDEGLSDCTHFVVLLTPQSIKKPWVKQEIDAGFALMLSRKKVKFIALRHSLQVGELPPLMRGMLSPEVSGPEHDLIHLVNEIHGVSKKPPLGPPPLAVKAAQQSATGYSAAATAILKLFSDSASDAFYGDPTFTESDLAAKLELTSDDVADALHELRNFVKVTVGHVLPETELFASFDKHWRDWDPEQDAIKLALDLVQDTSFPFQTADIAARYGWQPRRLNPALAYLINRKIILDSKRLGTMPWLTHWVQKTDETRRFARSRST
jgi:hypothetical protein